MIMQNCIISQPHGAAVGRLALRWFIVLHPSHNRRGNEFTAVLREISDEFGHDDMSDVGYIVLTGPARMIFGVVA